MDDLKVPEKAEGKVQLVGHTSRSDVAGDREREEKLESAPHSADYVEDGNGQ